MGAKIKRSIGSNKWEKESGNESLATTSIGDEARKNSVTLKQSSVSHYEKLFAGTSQSHVKLAVDGLTCLMEVFCCQEIQLGGCCDGEAIYDDIALRTLIALDGVNVHIQKLVDGFLPIFLSMSAL